MKHKLTVILSGVIAGAFMLGAASCGVDYKATPFDDPDVLITADLSGETNEISDTLFGIFLEDINYASYAMDDNMVVNGSFESTYNQPKTYGWSAAGATLTAESEGGALASLNETYKNAGTNPGYAKLVVTEAGGSLTNGGYAAVPMAVKKGMKYNFSAFVKSDQAVSMKVTVSDKNNTYLSSEIALKGNSEWIKYTQSVKATDTADTGLALTLTFSAAATVCLDAVQLETTDSTVGIKQYIYDALADLSPKFIRFPGGCITEGYGGLNKDGDGLADAVYDWKNSVGAAVTGTNAGDDDVPALTYPLVDNGKTTTATTYGEQITRTPNRDLWAGNTAAYYDMEYGVGFYEYFLLCDALDASAVPVLNCGYSCMGGAGGGARALAGRHGQKLNDFIRDALDLVAFAKGDPDSSDANEAKWARIRVGLGHSEPFDMTYLGIGNEQWGVYYTDYYEYFVKAFAQAKKDNPALYGEIQLIVGNGTQLSDCEGYTGVGATGGTAKAAARSFLNAGDGTISVLSEYGVHDQHYYRNYTEFLQYSSIYDSYSRKEADKYYVFVGEYSANTDTWQDGSTTFRQTNNSWLTALSEAAYMTGLERNGDVVKLAAYAPVFGAYEYSNHWAADMMFYTNTSLAFTPNYYVQQIFMKNQGSYTFQSEQTTASSFEPTLTLTAGNGNSVTVDKIYRSISYDEATGDIIVKIVNVGGDDVNINVSLLKNAKKLKSAADVTVLQNDKTDATSTPEKAAVSPETLRIGVESKFGYTAPKYSVTAIRLHTK